MRMTRTGGQGECLSHHEEDRETGTGRQGQGDRDRETGTGRQGQGDIETAEANVKKTGPGDMETAGVLKVGQHISQSG